MIRHFGNHFGRFDVQDPIKAAAMVGTLGGVSDDTKNIGKAKIRAHVAELQTKAVAINYAITMKKVEKKLKQLKKDLRKSKTQGKLAVDIAEANAETILALISKWNS